MHNFFMHVHFYLVVVPEIAGIDTSCRMRAYLWTTEGFFLFPFFLFSFDAPAFGRPWFESSMSPYLLTCGNVCYRMFALKFYCSSSVLAVNISHIFRKECKYLIFALFAASRSFEISYLHSAQLVAA